MSRIALTFLALGALLAFVASAEPKRETKPRVFVPESDSWSVGGELGIPDFSEGWDITGGAKPQTAEIVKTIHERCPKVVVTRKEENADYVLVLQHEGGKVFLRKDNKYAVFDADGDAITSGSTRSLGNAVKEACAAILGDWRDAGAER
jgi:hypothetical protein